MVVNNGADISWSGIPGAGRVEPDYSSNFWDATSGPQQHLNENIDVRTRSLFVCCCIYCCMFVIILISFPFDIMPNNRLQQ